MFFTPKSLIGRCPTTGVKGGGFAPPPIDFDRVVEELRDFKVPLVDETFVMVGVGDRIADDGLGGRIPVFG